MHYIFNRYNILLLSGVLMVAAPVVRASTDSPLAANLSINYQAPGARSQSMGGAFIGLSDDATATLVNPAGLVQLSKPEFCAQFTSGDSGMDIHNYSGYYHELWTINDPVSRVVSNGQQSARRYGNFQGFSFFSAALPTKHAVFAFSYSRPVAFHANAGTLGQLYSSEYVFDGTPYCSPGNNCFAINVFDRIQGYYGRLSAEQFSLSGAFRLGSKFSLGLTLGTIRFSQDFRNYHYNSSNRYSINSYMFSVTESGNSSDWTGVAGLLWRPNEKFQLGASYRRGAESRTTAAVGNINPFYTGFGFQLNPDSFENRTDLPDQFGLGLVYRPIPVFVIALDLNDVRYSRLTKGLRTFGQKELDLAATPDSFEIKDAIEPHLGLEYVAIVGGAPAVFRAGTWREARHGLRYKPDSHNFVDPNPPVSNPYYDPALYASNYNRFAQIVMGNRFPGGKNEMHYSAGIGMVVAQKVQLDMGYDYSRLTKQFVISGIYRFGHK